MAAGGPTRIILIRHGEDWHNRAKANLELADDESSAEYSACVLEDVPTAYSPLTAEGIAQAKAAGDYLNHMVGDPSARCYCSDYRRCAETAMHLDLAGARWVLDRRLREQKDPRHDVLSFLAEVMTASAHTVIIVSHANVMRDIICHLENRTLKEDRAGIVVENASVWIYDARWSRDPADRLFRRFVSSRMPDGTLCRGAEATVGVRPLAADGLAAYVASLSPPFS